MGNSRMTPGADRPEPRAVSPSGSAALREISVVILGALVWTGVTGMVCACFVWLMPLRSPLILQQELHGFGTAFAVSGAIGGSVSVAIYSGRRRACWLFVTLLTLLAVSLILTGWGITRQIAPRGPRFSQVWNRAALSIGCGLASGAAAGMFAALLVVIFAALTRRKITWRCGLAVDVILVAVGFWLLPQAIPWLATRTWESVGSGYGWGHEAAILGGFTGAALGSLIGPVVLTLVAGLARRSVGDNAA
jgi:hypothetical protein